MAGQGMNTFALDVLFPVFPSFSHPGRLLAAFFLPGSGLCLTRACC